MRMLGAASAGVVLGALVLTGAAVAVRKAATFPVSATLTASQEVPKQVVSAPNARGTFTGTVTANANKSGSVRWRLTFKNLSSKATAAHIHRGKPGKAGPIVVPLCGPCRSGAHGVAKLDEKTINMIKHNDAYVNVHTMKNPNGEIRGELRATGT